MACKISRYSFKGSNLDENGFSDIRRTLWEFNGHCQASSL